MARKLTPKQAEFVRQYLIDLNATQAAIRAGYSERRAMEIGYQQLQKTTVRSAIQAAMDRRAKRTEISADRVLLEYARLAFADMRSYFGWSEGGTHTVPSADLSDDDAAAIAEITFTETEVAEMVTKRQIKMKLHDKRGSLDALARHLKLDAAKQRHGLVFEEGEAESIDEELRATVRDMKARYVNGSTPGLAERGTQ